MRTLYSVCLTMNLTLMTRRSWNSLSIQGTRQWTSPYNVWVRRWNCPSDYTSILLGTRLPVLHWTKGLTSKPYHILWGTAPQWRQKRFMRNYSPVHWLTYQASLISILTDRKTHIHNLESGEHKNFITFLIFYLSLYQQVIGYVLCENTKTWIENYFFCYV